MSEDFSDCLVVVVVAVALTGELRCNQAKQPVIWLGPRFRPKTLVDVCVIVKLRSQANLVSGAWNVARTNY